MRTKDRDAAQIIGGCIGGTIAVVVITAFFLLLGAASMMLWNGVVVGLFGVNTIDYWMGLGIVVLLMFVGAFLAHK